MAVVPRNFHIGSSLDLESNIRYLRLLSPEAMVQLVYTLYKTVGETIAFAWGGMFGSFLGSVYPWVMFGLHPRGVFVYHPLDPAFIFGIVSGSVFVILMLWLNFDMLTKIFALSTFVWHWMGFMHPGKGSEYSNGFNIKPDGPMVQGLLAAVSGSLLAILITLFPYPILAAEKARETAETLVDMTGQTWSAAVAFYCNDHPDPYAMAELERSYEQMSKAMDTLAGHIDNSWWECFGRASMHRMRKMLYRLEAVSEETRERLTSIVAACKVEDWSPSHVSVMTRCLPHVQQVAERSHRLLAGLAGLACCGELPPEGGGEKARIRADVEDLRCSMLALATEFRAAKADAGLPEVSEQLLAEHAFCFSASSYGRIAIEYAEYMCDANFDETWREPNNMVLALKNGLGGIFDRSVLFDLTHINFAVKNSVAILLCFYIGLHGYSKMILQFSPGIANTASILLSRFTGSAMKKNLSRLQGVVIGLVVGEMAYAVLGWCELWAHIAMAVLLALWVSFTLFMYYDSPTYGGITILMAAFGTKYFLKECSSEVVDPAATYYSVIDVVVCIVLMTLVDSVLSLGRPSRMAHKSMVAAWASIQKAMESLFDDAKTEVRCRGGAIRGQIHAAEHLGNEAEDEPRFWRTPWRASVFAASARCAMKVRTDLANMEYCISPDHSIGDCHKSKLLSDFMNLPECKEVQKRILFKIGQIDRLLNILVHEEDATFPDVCEPEIMSDIRRQVADAMDSVISAANKAFDLKTPDDSRMLDEDDCARISVILLSFLGMVDSMRRFREAVVRG